MRDKKHTKPHISRDKKSHRRVLALTAGDLSNLDVALRLRVEACEENGESGAHWKRTHGKVIRLMELLK